MALRRFCRCFNKSGIGFQSILSKILKTKGPGRRNTSGTANVSPFPVLPLPQLPSPTPDQESGTTLEEKNLQLVSSVLEERKRVWSNDAKISSKDRGGRKLTVSERLKLLIDPGSEVLEIGTLAGLSMPYGDVYHGNNIVCVVRVCGEMCVVSANDWTFKGGTAYPISVKKQLRAQEIALANRLPCVYFVDSGGGFLPLQVHNGHCESFARLGSSQLGAYVQNLTKFYVKLSFYMFVCSLSSTQTEITEGECSEIKLFYRQWEFHRSAPHLGQS